MRFLSQRISFTKVREFATKTGIVVRSRRYLRVMKARLASRRIRFLIFLVTVIASIGSFNNGTAQEKVILKEVKITGNLRVEEDGIRLHIKNRPGELFDREIGGAHV